MSIDANGKYIESSKKIIPCDALILSVGLIPENELAESLGVKLSPTTNGIMIDQDFRSVSHPNIFACGNSVHVFDLVDYCSKSGEMAGKAAKSAGKAIGKAAKKAAPALKNAAKQAGKEIKNVAKDAAKDAAKDVAKDAAHGAVNMASDAAAKLSDKALQKIGEFSPGTADFIRSTGQQALDYMADKGLSGDALMQYADKFIDNIG